MDTRESERRARELAEELTHLTRLPVRWVVNTHWHWDHTFGNSVFDRAEIWGHQSCAVMLRAEGDRMREDASRWLGDENRHPIEEVTIVSPDHFFTERARLDIGREIQLGHHGLAHTDSDVVIRVSGSNVAFFGDLIEEGAPPAFEDSYPTAWPITLRRAAEKLPEVIVPGHGDVVNGSFVATQLEELTRVAGLASAFAAGDLSLEEATSSGPYPEGVMRTRCSGPKGRVRPADLVPSQPVGSAW